MAIFCPQCKAHNPFGAQICGDCGQNLAFDSTNLSNSSQLPKLPDVTNSVQVEVPAIIDDKNNNTPDNIIGNTINDTVNNPVRDNVNDPINMPVQKVFSQSGDGRADSPLSTDNKGKKNLPQFTILSEGKRDKSPFLVQVLAGILFAISLVLLATAGISFKMKLGMSSVLPFPFLASLPCQVELFGTLIFLAGFYTFIVAYSVSNLKKWAINLYISWVLVQIGLEVLTRLYQYKFGIHYSTVVMFQLIIIPFLWRIKYKFYY